MTDFMFDSLQRNKTKKAQAFIMIMIGLEKKTKGAEKYTPRKRNTCIHTHNNNSCKMQMANG